MVKNKVVCMYCKQEQDMFGKEHNRLNWCSMDCKIEFYKKYYFGSSLTKNLEIEHSKKLIASRKRVLKEIEDSGLSFVEYLQSLGKFKEE